MSDQPKKQELPPEDAAYLKQAEEFLTQSAKIGNAPLAYMIAAAFKNEAANKKLRADNEAKDARIAELEAELSEYKESNAIIKRDEQTFSEMYEAAEAKLKSVEGLLEEKYKFACFSHSLTKDGPHDLSYLCAEVDALLARISEAMKGDK